MDGIRVMIVDDHQLIREGVHKILALDSAIDVVAEAEDGEQAVKMVGLYAPRIVLMDINLPKLNGIEASRLIKKNFPETRIIALTIHDDEQYVAELVKVGIEGYILKDVGADQLVDAVKRVAGGGSYLDPAITPKVLHSLQTANQRQETEGKLTQREMEVLQLIANGRSNKEIAVELYISEKTVKNHLTNVFRKLNVQDRTQAALYAVKSGLVKI